MEYVYLKYRLLTYSLICTLSCCFSLKSSAKEVINVNSQSKFDSLQQLIVAKIYSGEKNIVVSIAPGTYKAKEKHLVFSKINAPEVALQINGNGAIIIPNGTEYKDGDAYKGAFSINHSWMIGGNNIDPWTHAHYAKGLIEILNSSTKECRLKASQVFRSDVDCSDAYILITQWFRTHCYKITKVSGNYIYFIAKTLAPGYKKVGYNINNDYHFAKQYPRYKLCNLDTGEDVLKIVNGTVKLPSSVTSVREGTIDRYITINNCKFRRLEIDHLIFNGNSNENNTEAISIRNTSCEILLIQNCVFNGFRSNVIAVSSSPNIHVENNSFQDCYANGISSDNGCAKTVIQSNTFTSMGKGMDNTFCVVCRGTEFKICNNTFTDFGYGGIGAGVHFKTKKVYECTGSVERNVLSYSQNYISDKANYTIMDSGAIYLWTVNNGITVRNNNIHNIDGMKTNQGIYCDDGASGIKIIGNVVLNCGNSNCIASRRDPRAEERNTPGTGIMASNLNNVIRDNIVDGRILFVGNERKVNGCEIGNNYVLKLKGGKNPKHKIENVIVKGRIVELECMGIKRGSIGVSRRIYGILEKNGEWKFLKNYVVTD